MNMTSCGTASFSRKLPEDVVQLVHCFERSSAVVVRWSLLAGAGRSLIRGTRTDAPEGLMDLLGFRPGWGEMSQPGPRVQAWT